MSDVSQGPGWWQASDGKWYPPQQAPGGAPAGGMPVAGGAVGGPPGAYAEWGTRVVATLIDLAIGLVGFIVIAIVALILGAISSALGALFFIVGYIAYIAYYFYIAFLTGVSGQSPGKKVMGIKVISEETGQPIGGGMGIVRQIVHFVDGICYIGYLFPLWDAKKQTLADKILKTISVTGVPKQSFGPNLFKQ